MFANSALCNGPAETLDFLTSLLHRRCVTHDTRPHQRVSTAPSQAQLFLDITAS